MSLPHVRFHRLFSPIYLVTLRACSHIRWETVDKKDVPLAIGFGFGKFFLKKGAEKGSFLEADVFLNLCRVHIYP